MIKRRVWLARHVSVVTWPSKDSPDVDSLHISSSLASLIWNSKASATNYWNSRAYTACIDIEVTPSERANEAALLKKRRELIDNGTDRKAIKIRNNTLIVNERPLGIAVDSTFQHFPLLSDFLPASSNHHTVSLLASHLLLMTHQKVTPLLLFLIQPLIPSCLIITLT